MPQVGPLEILVILVVAPVVLGPKKLPEIGRQVARGVGEFRNFQPGIRSEVGGAFDQPPPISAGKFDHPPRYEPPPADTTS